MERKAFLFDFHSKNYLCRPCWALLFCSHCCENIKRRKWKIKSVCKNTSLSPCWHMVSSKALVCLWMLTPRCSAGVGSGVVEILKDCVVWTCLTIQCPSTNCFRSWDLTNQIKTSYGSWLDDLFEGWSFAPWLKEVCKIGLLLFVRGINSGSALCTSLCTVNDEQGHQGSFFCPREGEMWEMDL